MTDIAIGLIGFGTIGAGVVHILQEHRDILQARTGLPLALKRVADVDLDRDRGVSIDPSILTRDAGEILQDPEISIVVELVGGHEPARSFILEALAKGKHVVTANKALLAEDGAEIFRAAHRADREIAFEAAVAGGIPILRSLREGLVANQYDRVLGILNGTCNYILSAMDEQPGISFQDMLTEAQALGYAEADPTLDVDGIDAAHKLVIMLSLTHGIRAAMGAFHVEGIRGIQAFDVQMAKEFAYTIKLLAVIKKHDGQIEARLHPTMIPRTHPLARVQGAFNGIFLQGDMVGDQLFYGKGAGREPTASAVVADIVEIARNVRGDATGRVPPLGYPEEAITEHGIMSMDQIRTNYYLRLQALDRPGVLSAVSGIMADHRISLHSVVQKQRHQSQTVPVVFLTHSAREADIQAAARQIAQLDVVEGPPAIVRIEDESFS